MNCSLFLFLECKRVSTSDGYFPSVQIDQNSSIPCPTGQAGLQTRKCVYNIEIGQAQFLAVYTGNCEELCNNILKNNNKKTFFQTFISAGK